MLFLGLFYLGSLFILSALEGVLFREKAVFIPSFY